MREEMPDISFERSMNHNYMILSRCSFFGKESDKDRDYRTKMLLENHIPGLLPVTHRLINGESRYYYEINSLQSLDRLYDKSEIRYDELRSLLSGCVSLFERLEEYLLDGTQVIIRPELIYINVEKMEPYFVCYPEYEGDVRLSFMEFIDGILTKIDHTDERAVMLGYQIYRYTRNPNYVISEIGNMMEHVIVNMAHRETDSARERPCFPMYSCETSDGIPEQAGSETPEPDKPVRRGIKKVSDLAGGIFCVFVALCSGTLILGIRLIQPVKSGGSSELYLYGAMAMAAVSAVLFFMCYFKKRNQDRESDREEDDPEWEEYAYGCGDGHSPEAAPYEDLYEGSHDAPPQDVKGSGIRKAESYNDTVYLGDGIVEERMLCGRINGKEVNISLDTLPMTVGKLADVSDYVINDTAVSKMHARFEEHDGRVYVCDLNSTNGTVCNGVMLGVNQSVALEPGDRLRFGRTYFTYC